MENNTSVDTNPPLFDNIDISTPQDEENDIFESTIQVSFLYHFYAPSFNAKLFLLQFSYQFHFVFLCIVCILHLTMAFLMRGDD